MLLLKTSKRTTHYPYIPHHTVLGFHVLITISTRCGIYILAAASSCRWQYFALMQQFLFELNMHAVFIRRAGNGRTVLKRFATLMMTLLLLILNSLTVVIFVLFSLHKTAVQVDPIFITESNPSLLQHNRRLNGDSTDDYQTLEQAKLLSQQNNFAPLS